MPSPGGTTRRTGMRRVFNVGDNEMGHDQGAETAEILWALINKEFRVRTTLDPDNCLGAI